MSLLNKSPEHPEWLYSRWSTDSRSSRTFCGDSELPQSPNWVAIDELPTDLSPDKAPSFSPPSSIGDYPFAFDRTPPDQASPVESRDSIIPRATGFEENLQTKHSMYRRNTTREHDCSMEINKVQLGEFPNYDTSNQCASFDGDRTDNRSSRQFDTRWQSTGYNHTKSRELSSRLVSVVEEPLLSRLAISGSKSQTANLSTERLQVHAY